MTRIIWVHPEMLFLLALLPAYWLVRMRTSRRSHDGAVYVSDAEELASVMGAEALTTRVLASVPAVLRVVAFLLFVVLLARPQWIAGEHERDYLGVDLVLAIDTSGSMEAMDFEIKGERVPRLDVVRNVIRDFVLRRPEDRFGIVLFGSRAQVLSPVTTDHDLLEKLIDSINIGDAGGDGTAIGDGVAVSAKRLKDLPAKSKLIILLTDGQNNSGLIQPEAAAEAANALGITIYTIGAGTRGEAPMPVNGPFGKRLMMTKVDIDEELLTKMAQRTGGQYFRATDTESLQQIYANIDKMEKSKIHAKEFHQGEDVFPALITALWVVILLECLWRLTPWARFPL